MYKRSKTLPRILLLCLPNGLNRNFSSPFRPTKAFIYESNSISRTVKSSVKQIVYKTSLPYRVRKQLSKLYWACGVLLTYQLRYSLIQHLLKICRCPPQMQKQRLIFFLLESTVPSFIENTLD
ncbi:hypothetical protein DP23_4378 [Ralstonia pickettii]|nr:hypothetical protein DP23_4378 [Ralstonia pickettii]